MSQRCWTQNRLCLYLSIQKASFVFGRVLGSQEIRAIASVLGSGPKTAMGPGLGLGLDQLGLPMVPVL